MSDLLLTSVFALPLGALYFALIVRVILLRRAGRVAFGDGDHKPLHGAIRAQGNAGEQTPLFLITFALGEMQDVPGLWLMVIGLVFVLGRFAHAYGMWFLVHRFRVYGTALNLTGFLLALAALATAVF